MLSLRPSRAALALIATAALGGIALSFWLCRRRPTSGPPPPAPPPQPQIQCSAAKGGQMQGPAVSPQAQNPLFGKQEMIVARFYQLLLESPILGYRFSRIDADKFKVGLAAAVRGLMGGPIPERVVEEGGLSAWLRKVHRGFQASGQEYREWVELWRRAEGQAGVKGKDLWGRIQHLILF